MEDPYVALLHARASDDSEEEQIQRSLSLVRAQGDAYGEALDYLATHVARDRGRARVGDFWVSYLCYPPAAGSEGEAAVSAEAQAASGQAVELGITVRDALDGRFVPNAEVSVTVTDPSGHDHGPYSHPMAWHPIFYQYVHTWTDVSAGPHRLSVRVAPPSTAGSVTTPRLTEPVVARFDDVHLLCPTGPTC